MGVTKTYGGFLLTQIKQIGGRVFEHVLKESGISEFNGPQGRILYVLWEHAPLTITQVGQLTSLASTTLTSMLDRMEQSGLITRRQDPKNRRVTLVETTQKAESLRKAYDDVSERTNEIFYAGFEEEEILSFESMLRRILENHERYIRDEK